jgi:RecB family exonuclease
MGRAEALRQAVEQAKAGDAFAPVTVVPASVGARLTLRRSLAAAAGGIANVAFLPLVRLARELVGARELRPVLGRAARHHIVGGIAESELGRSVLGGASSHPATVRSLEARLVELRACSPMARDALAAAGSPLLSLYDEYVARIAHHADDADVVRAATSAVLDGEWRDETVGRVVVFEPIDTSDPARGFIDAMVRAGRAVVIAPSDAPTGSLPVATRVVVAPDPESEVRMVIGEIARLLARGTPLSRIAVVHGENDGYARLAAELFDGARLRWGGVDPRPLSESTAGRTLLDLLALPDAGWSRVAAMGVISGGPIVDAEAARTWERAARRANVVAGVAQWHDRVGDGAPDLVAFIDGLTESLRPPPNATWSALTRWALDLLPASLATYPGHDDVVAAVLELAALDQPYERPTVEAFVAALAMQLDRSSGWRSAGDGLLLGTTRDLAGADVDAVLALGMVEGSMPARHADDPLLPDALRAVTGGELSTRPQRRARERALLADLLRGATERVLCAPRADQRGQRRRLPSRWLLDAAPHDGRLRAHELDALAASVVPPGWLVAPPSVASVVLDRPAASTQEDALQSLAAGVDPAGFGLGRGFEATRARRSADVTLWDGDVDAHPALVLDDALVAATRLEVWAECPFRYFLRSVLHVNETTTPEDRVGIDPLDRGTLVHDVLERLVARRIDAERAGEHLDEEAELARITEDECRRVEQSGKVGRALPWLIERRTLDAHLQAVLALDREDREQSKLSPVAAEVTFGDDSDLAAAVVERPGGGRVRFRGKIDRVDASADGSSLRVTDYKTGKSEYYRRDLVPPQNATAPFDPTAAGARLQLPIYAIAAAPLAAHGASITAEYWFVTDAAKGYVRVPVPLDDATAARVTEVVDTIASGVEAGAFPALPGDTVLDSWQHCRRCPYDRVCPADRGEAADRKTEHPAARRHAALRLEST